MKYFLNLGSWLTVNTGTGGGADTGAASVGCCWVISVVAVCDCNGGGGGIFCCCCWLLTGATEAFLFSNFKSLNSSTEFNFLKNEKNFLT